MALNVGKKPQAVNFLCLPKDVRMRIYRHSNLIRPCPIDVFDERGRVKGASTFCASQSMARRVQPRSPIENPCHHPALPLNILRVSHAVFEDASSALYSQNQFRLTLEKAGDFEQLMQIIKPYLHLVKSLHVDLGTYDDRILRLENISEYPIPNILRLWEMFCDSVPQTIPGLKDFSLECRIVDGETAERVLSPMKSFPLLNRCAFCFDLLVDIKALDVARNVAYARTSMIRENSSTPFRFLDLPVELQSMIMEHLLTFRWDPFLPPLPSLPRKLAEGQIVLRRHTRQGPSHLLCCGTCSTSTSTCFCSIRGAVFSTHCSCFTSPLPYFLVCRDMYAVAHSVFFLKNQFCLLGDDPQPMMRAVQTLSDSSLSLIRHLTFGSWTYLYDSEIRTDLLADPTIRLAWSILLHFLKDRLRLESVSVNFVDLGCYTTHDAILEWRVYMRQVIQFFCFFRGVRNFHVFLGYDRRCETEVEETVMGPRDRVTRVKNLPFVGSKTVIPIDRVSDSQ
ncbi:hypothetical protein V8E54_015255 [Elaphomyces granulatus]